MKVGRLVVCAFVIWATSHSVEASTFQERFVQLVMEACESSWGHVVQVSCTVIDNTACSGATCKIEDLKKWCFTRRDATTDRLVFAKDHGEIRVGVAVNEGTGYIEFGKFFLDAPVSELEGPAMRAANLLQKPTFLLE